MGKNFEKELKRSEAARIRDLRRYDKMLREALIQNKRLVAVLEKTALRVRGSTTNDYIR